MIGFICDMCGFPIKDPENAKEVKFKYLKTYGGTEEEWRVVDLCPQCMKEIARISDGERRHKHKPRPDPNPNPRPEYQPKDTKQGNAKQGNQKGNNKKSNKSYHKYGEKEKSTKKDSEEKE